MALVFQPLVAPGDPEKPVLSIPEGRVSLSLGRSGENDFSIDEASVSTLHARIERNGLNGSDVVDLIDCGSSNGTFVNGKKVERHPVRAGDLIRLAGAEFRVVDTDAVEKAEEFHKAEIESLERELSTVRAERDEALEQNKTRSRELQNSARDIEALEERSEKRTAELSELREQNLNLESQIAALQFELSQRDGTIEKANRERDEARQRNEDWQVSYEDLTGQLAEKTKEHLESQRDLQVSQEALQLLTQKIGLMTEQLLSDWKGWFSDEEMPEGGESADGHLEKVEAGRQKIREELNKIEPIWFEFGDGVQEELKRRCNDLKLEQRSLTEENRDKRKVLEQTEKDLAEIRATVDEEIRRAQGLSRRGTKVTLPEGYDTMVIAKDREQAIYEELITQIEYFESLLVGYRKNRKLRDAVEELEGFRKRLEKILHSQGVEPFEIPVGTMLTLKHRREVQILGKKGWGTRDFMEQPFQPGEVTKVVRPGYRVGGEGEKAVILRKVEVLIREASE